MAAAAAEAPYNDAADAKLDIWKALADSVTNNKPVIVVFGANWCGDCKIRSFMRLVRRRIDTLDLWVVVFGWREME